MITAIFAAHGLEYGQSGRSRGYATYEHPEVKRWLKENKAVSGVRQFQPPVAGFAEFAEGLGINLVKIGVEWWPLTWDAQPHYVKIKRDPWANAKSLSQKRGFDFTDCLHAIRRRHQLLDSVPGPTVDSDAVIAGDFATLENAFEHCGLAFDPATARLAIKPDQWHFAA